jgi:hypothetical protein
MNILQQDIDVKNCSYYFWRGMRTLLFNKCMMEDDHVGDTTEVQKAELEPKITLHALTRWNAPRTMCMTY